MVYYHSIFYSISILTIVILLWLTTMVFRQYVVLVYHSKITAPNTIVNFTMIMLLYISGRVLLVNVEFSGMTTRSSIFLRFGGDGVVCWFFDVLFHAELNEHRQNVFVDETICIPW